MDKMEYTTLGDSGLKVSRFSYGNWVNCPEGEDSQEKANKLVKLAFDNGVNLFDTAEAYGFGEGERQMGAALRALNIPREDYVLTTKIFWGKQKENVNAKNVFGVSRKHLIEGVNRSLKLLQHDYVDILFCHRYDHTTPTKEVCETMKILIESGKVLYWGTSEWPAARIMEAIHICDKIGAPRPIAEQCEYNLYNRKKVEAEYAPLFDDYKLGTTVWSPLCSGILTGKYNNGIPEDCRFKKAPQYARIYDRYFADDKKEATIKALQAFEELAKSLGDFKSSQLALAWTLKSNDVSTTLLGASSEEQLSENLKALEVVPLITKEVEQKIEDIFKTAPEQERNYHNWTPLPGRRGI